jgi:hypothetical protein
MGPENQRPTCSRARRALESGVRNSPAERTQTLKNAVLCDLIMTLMKKKVLTEREGKDLLRKLFV